MYKRFLLSLAALLLLSGCWDKVEVNDRAFAIAMGIDVRDDQYTVTFVFPNLPVYTGRESGEAMFQRTVTGSTLAGCCRELAVQMNKTLNYEHLEALVFGEGLLKNRERMTQAVDFLGRDGGFPRKIPVLVAEKAEKILSMEQPQSETVGEYINGIYANNRSVIRGYKVSLQHFLEAMEAESPLLMPVLYQEEEGLRIADAYAYDGRGVQGLLSMRELEALSWLRDSADGMEFMLEMDGCRLSLEVDQSETRYLYYEEDGRLFVRASIEASAQIREYEGDGELLDPKTMRELEELTERNIERDISGIVERMQQEYREDFSSMFEPLKFSDRALYLRIKQEKDQIFRDMDFSVEVRVVIEKIGMIR